MALTRVEVRKSRITKSRPKKAMMGQNSSQNVQKIVPYLWFDNQAEEAVNFYVSIYKNSKIGDVARYGESGAQASGMLKDSVMTMAFTLEGQDFLALNGGPVYKFTPAISLYVQCETPQEINRLWKKLSAGGTVLMPLDKYPFSERFGWLNDKYGLSWQFNLERGEQKITPCLMYIGKQAGKAEEAMKYYVSLFEDSQIGNISRYRAGEGDIEGYVNHGVFSLNGQEFFAMDSSLPHAFAFTPAISFLVNCETQPEIDHFWEKLSEGGEQVQCGWLTDKYGVSWQIVPTVLGKLMSDKDARKSGQVMQAMLQMKKIDIALLQQAYEK